MMPNRILSCRLRRLVAVTPSKSVLTALNGLWMCRLHSTDAATKHVALPSLMSLVIRSYKVHVLEAADQCEKFFAKRRTLSISVAGLDCEWVGRRPVALLQLAFPNKECVLVRLNKIGCITPSLSAFLNDQSILKCGVGIAHDASLLQKDYKTSTLGLVDLSQLADHHGITTTTGLGLKKLTKQIAGYNLKKSRYIAHSNWEAETLAQHQVMYAGSDAIAALVIMECIVSDQLAKQQNSYYLRNFISKIVNPWRRQEGDVRSVLEKDEGVSCMHALCHGLVYSTSKTASRSDVRKYLLGSTTNEMVPIRGQSVSGSGDLSETPEMCYVCGGAGLCKKRIVPREYTKHFPEHMNERNEDDFLFICRSCLDRYVVHHAHLRKELATEYNAPLHSLENDGEVSHGRTVAMCVQETVSYSEFKRRWQQDFIDKMEPQYLPVSWTNDHKLKHKH